MKDVTVWDSMRIDDIRTGEGLRCKLSEQAEQSAMRRYGKMEKISQKLLQKRLYLVVDGVQRRGRPRTIWLEGMRRVMNEKGLTIH